jgi:protein TonB
MATRLVFAAVLAIMVHGVLLVAEFTWVTPRLPPPHSREVTISLVTVEKSKPAPEAGPTAPKPKPPPKAVPRPKPKPKVTPVPEVRKPEPPPAEDPAPAQDDHPPSEPLEKAALPSPSAPETEAAVELSVPLYEINPPPNYPSVARRRRYEGTVVLNVLVDTTGRAAEVTVAQSSGYAVLDRSAKADVSRWRFKPARKGFRTVEMWVKVPVRYELKK